MSEVAAVVSTGMGNPTAHVNPKRIINPFVEKARLAYAKPKLEAEQATLAKARKQIDEWHAKRTGALSELERLRASGYEDDEDEIRKLNAEVAQANDVCRIIETITIRNSQAWVLEYTNIVNDAERRLLRIGEKP
jgi:hypothetical protein